MRRRVLIGLVLSMAALVASAETRSARIDFVLFVDTSLSMVDAMEEAKAYVASELIGRLVEPGDWFSLHNFYGKSELVWQGEVRDEGDVAEIVRRLNALKADGRFTDIGSALDTMERILDERGRPERPKYVLLITDERQEAPRDSLYYAPDYQARHPLLEYVKRVDKGLFRVVTIGYGISARVELEARALLTTLTEPPVRPDPSLPGGSARGEPSSTPASSTPASSAIATGAPSSADGSPQAAGQPGSSASASAAQGQAGSAAQPSGAPQGRAGDASPAGEAASRGSGFSGAPLAAGIAAAGAVGIALAVLLARRRRRREDEETRTAPREPGA